MSLTLLFLKLIGVLVTGASTAWALIADASSENKQRARKYLLALSVLGVVVALGAQIGDSWKSRQDDDQNNKKAEILLNQIERAVTRIDYISMDVSFRWPFDNSTLAPYRDRIAKLVEDAESQDLSVGEDIGGLRVVTRGSDHISIFNIIEGSDALPKRQDGTAFSFGVAASHPRMGFYKAAPDATVLRNFVKSGLVELPKPDLTLIPKGGSIQVTLVPNGDFDPSPFSMAESVHGLQVPRETWSQSGRIISIGDLPGSTAIISINSTIDVQRTWTPPTIDLHLNGQVIHIDSSSLQEFKGDWATVYVFTLPLRADHIFKQ